MHHGRPKIGVPVFSYTGFDHFQRELASRGSFSVNLGDSMQTLAVRAALREIGVDPADVVDVDRDTLQAYDGPPVAVVLNGVFHERCFPLPPRVIPIFIGFRLAPAAIGSLAGYFSGLGPIGCRDSATMEAFRAAGVEAYVSGCLTLSLQPRTAVPASPRTFLAYGTAAGAFPCEALGFAPRAVLQGMELAFQRLPMGRFPVGHAERQLAEQHAAALLADYRERAGLVVTSLHHAAAPCIASGIPVIICREWPDPRFTFLGELLPIHVPGDFNAIDWAPPPIDVAHVRQAQLARLREAVASVLGG
ncbi:MAG: hypothetical protein EBZ59_04110 [Planctomycetia bacterium]|nr:hypothetical protein [Planctomycetia bacterium]